MKIGIITYHRAENYGALLQAYALKSFLETLGHNTSFVDYWPKYHSDYFRLFPVQQLKKERIVTRLKLFIKMLVWLYPRYVRKCNLQNFMLKHLGLSKHILYPNNKCNTEEYEIVVYGSDQIWRKQNLGGVEFDSWYFGIDNVRTKRKIVYAGSMGAIVSSIQDDKYMQRMMQNFTAISVRENDLQVYLHGLGIKASVVMDPVFLLCQKQWKKVFREVVPKEKYILFYNLLNTSESVNFAEKLSKKTNLPIKELNKTMSFHCIGKRYYCSASIEKFLELICGAEYVVSNSFHGVAMSIIFQKQFYAVGMSNKSNRVKSLLQNLNLSERYFDGYEKDILVSKSIDYNQVLVPLEKLIFESKMFLKNSL